MGRFNLFRLGTSFIIVVLGWLIALQAVNASIVPTDVSFDLPFHGYGSYSKVTANMTDVLGCCNNDGSVYVINSEVARSELAAHLFFDRIDISGSAAGGGYFSPDFQEHFAGASTNGSISFELDKSILFDFFWHVGGPASEWSSGFNPHLEISNDLDGTVVVACGGILGCEYYPVVEPFYGANINNGSPQLRAELSEGSYTMDFFVSTDHGAGMTVDANFSLSIKEVPLPPSAFLMLIGLGAVLLREHSKSILSATQIRIGKLVWTS